MVWSVKETDEFCRRHAASLQEIATITGHTIVLCPSFLALSAVAPWCFHTPLRLGAQDCNCYGYGAYTGAVAAAELRALGCDYCIIGHSERRKYFHETRNDCALKLARLVEANIEPIVCIDLGDEVDSDDVLRSHVRREIELLCAEYARFEIRRRRPAVCNLWLAYEPSWAIGGCRAASPEHLMRVYTVMNELCVELITPGVNVRYMYGGGLTDATVASVVDVPYVEGFLVGGASLDFQKFRNMIALCVR